jgi:hypothetical protein
MGTGSFPEVKSGRGVTLTPHPLLVPRSKKQSRAILLLSLRAFVPYKKDETYLPNQINNQLAMLVSELEDKHNHKSWLSFSVLELNSLASPVTMREQP